MSTEVGLGDVVALMERLHVRLLEAGELARERDVGPQPRLGDADGRLARREGFPRGADGEIARGRLLCGGLAAARQLQAEARHVQVSRQRADLLLVAGARRGELRLGRGELRLPVGVAGAGLRNVGQRDVAGGVLLLRGAQRAVEQRRVGAVQADDALVARHVEVGSAGREQDGRFRVAQLGALGEHLRLGLLHLRRDPAAGVEGLRQRQRRNLGDAVLRVGLDEAVGDDCLADLAEHRHARTPPRERARDTLVRLAQRGAAGGELRVVEVGLAERRLEALRPARPGEDQRERASCANHRAPPPRIASQRGHRWLS